MFDNGLLPRRTVLGTMASFFGYGGARLLMARNVPLPRPDMAFAPAPLQALGDAEPPQVVSTFTATPGAQYPFRENMYRVLQLPDGCVIALSIARSEGQQTMQGRYSSDAGRSWSTPENLFLWPKDAGGFALFDSLVDHHGEIHICILCDGNSGTLLPKAEEGAAVRPGEILDIWHVRSRNGRTQWDRPKPIWLGHGDDLLSFIQLRNGRLLLPSASAFNRSWGGDRGGGFMDYTYSGSYCVSALYSDDGGDTWTKSADELAVETPDLGTYGADEPVVIELTDGRVWMLMRTQRGRFYESFSSDGGAHWTPAQPSTLLSSDSPAALLRLKDGSILLFSNACQRFPYAYGGRDALHVAISRDEGRTWRGFREVALDPLRNQPPPHNSDYGLSYTFPTLLADGKVLFTNWVQTGRDRDFRLLDPAWILASHHADDFSQGLARWSTFGSKGVELLPDPERPGAQALAVRKADLNWPAGAVWNFPAGSRGRLKLQISLRPGFGGVLLGLTDQFSVPWDVEDRFHNVFNLPVQPNGRILADAKLNQARWHELVLDWSTARRECRIWIDGHSAGVVHDYRRAAGINYLRVRSTAVQPDAGLMIRSVNVTVDGIEAPDAFALPGR